jgi:SAM-dependent methyltransferase
MSNPPCPITGEPAESLVQWVSAKFLIDFWRIVHKADARSSFGAQDRFGLWRSPTGLYFFDPMIAGDSRFYTQFYDWLLARKLWSQEAIRHSFTLAAARVGPGDRVLDVGCGFGNFRALVPHADYVGLDPNFGANLPFVRREHLSDHLRHNAGAYEIVCAFEVLEHLASPTEMFADMVRATRPGGLVVVSVPHVPSALTRIPNFLLNAPPHHLTWWTETALRALAATAGVCVESIEPAQWNETDSLMYWMARCSPIRCRDIHFHDAPSWYVAGAVGFLVGRLAYALNKTPKTTDEGAALVMVARRGAEPAQPAKGL